MKICIPTEDDRKLESRPFGHFGSAPFFTIVDTENGDLRVVRNPACRREHGACHHIPIIKAHDVEAVVCNGVGRRAFAAFEEAGISVLHPRGQTVAEIIEAIRTGATRALTADEACAGHGGGHHGHRAAAGERHHGVHDRGA
jgi:predicted Fe-Mo cluster-binding NifX family protein